MSLNLVVGVAVLYGALLFFIAFWADRRARAGHWVRMPLVYTLSLSIYCTAWTFYGAVGYAARSGLEYLTIYLGPTLVMVGWWGLLRRLVRVGREQRITSIADLISSRFGKSGVLGVLVTGIAVVATTPYIALQLQSVTLSLEVLAQSASGPALDLAQAGFWVALGLAVFAVAFGTRSVDADERHHGVVMAIAVEAVVKLVALMAVGVFVVWGLAGGVGDVVARIDASALAQMPQRADRWIGLTMVSAMAFLTLPRMFQVLVVENANDQQLATASWAFPAYLMAMSLFVVPIAVVGRAILPEGANPDMFVLTVPLSQGHDALAMLAFLGGFSSASAMVVVAALALATMVSNHVVLPLWLSITPQGASMSGDIRRVLILSRRCAIPSILALGYLYYRQSGGGEALAAIGTISFVGIAQIGPALLAGLLWRGATRFGAIAGVSVGFVVWAWTLFLPSVGAIEALWPSALRDGPFGLAVLRPNSMFGVQGLDPVLHATVWSLVLNVGAVLVGSLGSRSDAVERLQAMRFTSPQTGAPTPTRAATVQAQDLLIMSQRILGPKEAQAFFETEAKAQGRRDAPEVTPPLLERLERLMAGSVGAATAHAMVGQMAGESALSAEDLFAVADEAAQIMEYSARLEAKSAEQERTARALRDANAKLRALGHQKDAFLSQISHELRTPMTSIRSFSTILAEDHLASEDRQRFVGIIQDEALRLTRLLDDLLDLSVLESGQVTLNRRTGGVHQVLDQAQAAAGGVLGGLMIERLGGDQALNTDLDRLAQVFINLMTNAAKYCDAPVPCLRIRSDPDARVVDFIDNGSGIPAGQEALIFEKFARLSDGHQAGGAGLGLAICQEIMARLGGRISYVAQSDGPCFRVHLPTDYPSPISVSETLIR